MIGEKTYSTSDNIADFTNTDRTSETWKKMNQQFLNYHKSLSVYTMLNASPINNYIGFQSGVAELKNIKVLDVGAGTGHAYCSFFHQPETIEYYLLDPNLRLLHDQFYRIYPKLSFLKMAHILANAEYLPIKDNSFDLVLNLSAVDHFDDYKRFINESYRVLKQGGLFFITSHLDIPESKEDVTSFKDKIISETFYERVARYKYFKKHAVGSDDHTLHLENEKPIEDAILAAGFKIEKKELFKRHFYFVARK